MSKINKVNYMAFFCKGGQKGCPSNSMSEPFENGMCDACWEKANVEDQKHWDFCRICPERATENGPWCKEHSTAGKPLYMSIEWSEMNEGSMFNAYDEEQAMRTGDESLCGGLCTGTLQDAFEMAFQTYMTEVKV